MVVKKFVPCIYLYYGKAVRNLKDVTVVDTDPVRLARYYSENNADELIVFDLSARAANELAHSEYAPEDAVQSADRLHEEALDLIREICSAVEVDVTGVGNIRRVEDVKKLLYAGCKRVVLNYENVSNIALTEEVSLRFGREKVLAACDETYALEGNLELIQKYVSALLLLNPHVVRDAAELLEIPFYVQINQVALNKLMDIFSFENVCGVTGNCINDNVKEILTLKQLCQENGLPVVTLDAVFRWEDFKKNSDGLVPVVVQDYKTQEVLMVAYMDETAYQTTLHTGKMTYYSRSRRQLWVKGETSGHYQYVRSLYADCDMDTILARVHQIGPACHTGAKSCFFNRIVEKETAGDSNPLKVFEEVFDVIKDRKVNPKEGSYTNYLFDKGLDKILKKLGEEATEIVIAAKNPNENEVKYEISDFLYHMMVLMAEKGVTWEDITEELAKR